MKYSNFFLLLFIFAFIGSWSFSKKRVELRRADKLEVKRVAGEEKQELTGRVLFEHNNTFLHCDRALLYSEENRLEAFGNVRIIQGDSLEITGDYLDYSGNKNKALVTGNQSVMKTKTAILYTKKITFDTQKNHAVYDHPGKLFLDDSTILTSEKGEYFDRKKLAKFKENVILENKDFTLKNELLIYNTQQKKASFNVYTEIFSKDMNANALRGNYASKEKNISMAPSFFQHFC